MPIALFAELLTIALAKMRLFKNILSIAQTLLLTVAFR